MLDRRLPLRQRKRIAAMERIQEVAFRLLVDQGFEATTVEQIADRADVSPSSVYRYFGGKEDVFLWDPWEQPFLDRLEDELSSERPVDAVERAMHLVLIEIPAAEEDALRSHARVLAGVPVLWTAMRRRFTDFESEVVSLIEEAGTPSLEARVAAATATAAIWVAFDQWQRAEEDASLATIVDQVFAILRDASR